MVLSVAGSVLGGVLTDKWLPLWIASTTAVCFVTAILGWFVRHRLADRSPPEKTHPPYREHDPDALLAAGLSAGLSDDSRSIPTRWGMLAKGNLALSVLLALLVIPAFPYRRNRLRVRDIEQAIDQLNHATHDGPRDSATILLALIRSQWALQQTISVPMESSILDVKPSPYLIGSLYWSLKEPYERELNEYIHPLQKEHNAVLETFLARPMSPCDAPGVSEFTEASTLFETYRWIWLRSRPAEFVELFRDNMLQILSKSSHAERTPMFIRRYVSEALSKMTADVPFRNTRSTGYDFVRATKAKLQRLLSPMLRLAVILRDVNAVPQRPETGFFVTLPPRIEGQYGFVSDRHPNEDFVCPGDDLTTLVRTAFTHYGWVHRQIPSASAGLSHLLGTRSMALPRDPEEVVIPQGYAEQRDTAAYQSMMIAYFKAYIRTWESLLRSLHFVLPPAGPARVPMLHSAAYKQQRAWFWWTVRCNVTLDGPLHSLHGPSAPPSVESPDPRPCETEMKNLDLVDRDSTDMVMWRFKNLLDASQESPDLNRADNRHTTAATERLFEHDLEKIESAIRNKDRQSCREWNGDITDILTHFDPILRGVLRELYPDRLDECMAIPKTRVSPL